MAKEPIEDLYLSGEDLKQATVITEGEKHWTFRGYNLIFDKPAIKGASETHKAASRIFLTGEAPVSYIGEEAADFLLGMNDSFTAKGLMADPLFVMTNRGTIRMPRYDPEFVWRCINPKLLIDLARDEAGRLGLNMEPGELEYMDFYESMIWYMKEKNGDFIIPAARQGMSLDERFYAAYFACLLLFGKPGYMGAPVTEYFTDPEVLEYFKGMEYRELDKEGQEKVLSLREEYGKIRMPSNPELLFINSLFKES